MEQFPEQEQEIKLRDYYRIIIRHIKLIAIIFCSSNGSHNILYGPCTSHL